MSEQVLAAILQRKIIAIVRGIDKNSVIELVSALKKGGIDCIEITFDQSSPAGIQNTLDSIRAVRECFGTEIVLGAGTVLTPEQVETAKHAGASFILSPNTDTAVIQKTKELGLVSIPGALTATEAVCAWQAGADIVKLFPLAQLGPAYIQALKGPLAHIRFSAVGGVNEHNAAEFLQAGACSVGVGGNLVSKKMIAAGEFTRIETLAATYIQAIN